jgi:hypothetical protein
MASQIFAITVRPSTKWEEPLHVEAALENRPVARARGGGLRWWIKGSDGTAGKRLSALGERKTPPPQPRWPKIGKKVDPEESVRGAAPRSRGGGGGGLRSVRGFGGGGRTRLCNLACGK